MLEPPTSPLGLAALPEALRARIEAELAPGERLLWASQPEPGRPRGPRRSTVSVWIWLGGWVTLGGMNLAGLLFLPHRFESGFVLLILGLFGSGIATTLIGTHLLASFTKHGSWRRRSGLELYALTDRRALIWGPAERSTAAIVTQILPGSVHADLIVRLEYPDGRGNLTWGANASDPDQDGFFGVAEIRQVDALVRRILTTPDLIPPSRRTANWRFRPSTNDPDDTEEPF